ncbi:MAG TPA: Ig-like domain-containing protein [Candidatus Baltobacteraceae bacterium]|jgi:hypothetical protein|nr:Ig-like domain-containing protein [Candidatus Baltobacteraceae bacterium]
MKNKNVQRLLLGIGLACACGASAWAQTIVPSTFKQITIDGSFDDWNGVPLAYAASEGQSNAIQFENVYIANDQTNLYIEFTLYAPWDAFDNSYDNLFIDADNNPATGYVVSGIGSEMLIQGGAGYQEAAGIFNDGGVDNLGWAIAGSTNSMQFELSISLGATFASDGAPVFTNNTIALVFEGDTPSYDNVEFVPAEGTGGLVYTLAPAPAPLSNNLPLITLTNSVWEVNASGTDLGTNWLGQTYDDTGPGWTNGDGLFGYTPTPASYPAIDTPLTNGPSTYYFRTAFEWTNDAANVAFVVTNYLSDGAIYYLNGVEVEGIRMPAGPISYSTMATGTNFPVGQPDVFGINGGELELGTNTLEVEAHQAPDSSGDMIFGLSLTAAIQYPVLVVDTNQPADQTVLAGQAATFTSDILGSGPLVYQWFFDGTNAIAGANGSTYTIPYVLTNNAGTYSLSVSNQFTNVSTRAALLTVSNTPVIIDSQPVNQLGIEGQSVSFSVAVSGTPIIDYQWFFGTNAIPGATNASYTIPSTLPTDSGGYYVTVSNPASTTNSSIASLTVLADTIPPNIVGISATATQIVITFSKPVDPVTAGEAGNYSVAGGVTVLTAVPDTNNAAQVTLTTGGAAMTFGTVYSLTVTGVNDLFGNPSQITAQFVRDITIDGSFDDWNGLAPSYSTATASGNTNAADFEDIYVYNDANFYYFRVTLWTDINSASGEFPAYVNMYFDTDNNPATGFSVNGVLGSEMLVQSGIGYQEKDRTFNDGYGINGLDWLCLPAEPGTNFEFEMSRAATFGEDGTPVFTTNLINFIFLGQNPQYGAVNWAPPIGGFISYTNAVVPSLPLGKLAIESLSGGQAAIIWGPPGTLQYSTNLNAAWINVPAASSPYVVPATGVAEFFRLSQ